MARKLAYTVYVTDEDGAVQKFGPTDDVPGWAAKAITNPSAWADGDGGDESPTPDPSTAPDAGGTADYSKMDKGQLEEAVNARNEGRADDDKIVVGGKGNKPDLIRALKADDENTAGA